MWGTTCSGSAPRIDRQLLPLFSKTSRLAINRTETFVTGNTSDTRTNVQDALESIKGVLRSDRIIL